MIRIKIVSFTASGARTGTKLAKLLESELTEQYARSEDLSLAATELARFAQQAMVDCDWIIFICEPDTAVRVIAPYIQNNGYDPAVSVVNEAGTIFVPLLKSRFEHVNDRAERILHDLQAFHKGEHK